MRPSRTSAIRVMGVDPGLARTGYGVISVSGNSMEYLECGIIRTDADEDMPERLVKIAREVGEVAGRHRPSHAVIEKVFVNSNPMSSLKLGEARGAAVIAAAQSGAAVLELTTTEIKRAITGRGNSSKLHVGTMVRSMLGLGSAFSAGHDAFDALACAICFQLSGRLASAAAGA